MAPPPLPALTFDRRCLSSVVAGAAVPGDAPEPPCLWGSRFELSGEAARRVPSRSAPPALPPPRRALARQQFRERALDVGEVVEEEIGVLGLERLARV
jgi:hypothetical protein